MPHLDFPPLFFSKMSGAGRKLRSSSVSVNIGCCCRKSKLTYIFHPKPKSKVQKTTQNGTAFYDTEAKVKAKNGRSIRGFGRIGGGESLAVEKDSDDPYMDFRHSMVQMIMENEIYSKEDLRELLRCFLQLNSPYHHGIIVRAFTEIWNGGGVGGGCCSVKSGSEKQHFGYKARGFVEAHVS